MNDLVTAQADPGEATTRAERVGWYFYDWANSAFATSVVTVFLGPYLISIAENAEDARHDVHLLGIPLASGSVFAYAVSLSVLLQVFALPLVGAVADRSARKKQLLALFAYIGAGATIALMFLTGGRWLLGAALFVLANVSLGASNVVYNSFLPQIAGPDERDRVSSVGWAIGYIGGGLLLALNLVVYTMRDSIGVSEGTVARWSIVSAGLWWAAFTTLPLLRLRNRPPVAGTRAGSPLTDGFKQLGRTFQRMRAYPLTIMFLVAYLIYNDGIQTVITQAAVFADKELHLDKSVQIETILLVQFLAFGGALLLGRLSRRYGARNTIAASIVVWLTTLALAYVLPARQPLLFMALGALIGIVLGGSQALSRSLYSQLIPPDEEAEYFGIYEIASDGTTWLGPLLFGLAYQLTGSYRVAIISLLVFFVVGLLMLLRVPIRRAIVEAGNTPPRVV